MRRVAGRMIALTAGLAAPGIVAGQQHESVDQIQHRRLGTRAIIEVVYEYQDRIEAEEQPVHVLYLASSANNWNPRHHPRDRVIASHAPPGAAPYSCAFEVPVESALAPGFEFKFTRGSWETVEVGPDGRDIPNRRLTDDERDRAARGQPIFFTIAGFADQRPARWPELARAASTVTGDLRIHDMPSVILGNTRKIRVWLPPGYDAANAEMRYPVLYMHDGQNCFDAATSFAGEWGVDETLTRLIDAGDVPPMIVVGIDNAGAERSNEYSPIALGARRPNEGGRGDLYIRFITDEVMPFVDGTYRTKTGPEHTAMGGSSLGGVITLHAAIARPAMLGAILVESPSFWVGDGEFLRRVTEQRRWPGRVFMAMGDAEYGEASRDAELVGATHAAERAMREAGLDEACLRVVVEPGARHNEPAWAGRLPEALRFLFHR